MSQSGLVLGQAGMISTISGIYVAAMWLSMLGIVRGSPFEGAGIVTYDTPSCYVMCAVSLPLAHRHRRRSPQRIKRIVKSRRA